MSIILHEDREFRNLTIPASQNEMDILEKSICLEGCLEPIITWKNTIIDGYKRYMICREEGLDYSTKMMSFPCRDEAIIWVCRKRLDTLERNSDVSRYLIGKIYISTKEINNRLKRNNGYDEKQSLATDGRVSITIGQEFCLNCHTIEKYGAYAAAMDKVSEKDQELFEMIMTGKKKIDRNQVIRLVQNNFRGIRALKSSYNTADVNKPSAIDDVVAKSGTRLITNEVPLSVGIKEMPAFDPDMELNGLALTIPAWTAAIARAVSKSDMALVSEKAKEHIKESLKRLEKQIQETLEALK